MKRLLIGIVVVVAYVFSLSISDVHSQAACNGNFDCDQDVDGGDAANFKLSFGRSQFNDPCPTCNDSPCPCSPCPYGMVDCVNKCADPMTDREYCGADMNCMGGTACGDGQICAGGVCTLNCPTGLTNCGGVCVDTDVDESYCGSCTNSCTSGEMCVAGSCDPMVSGYPAPVEKTGQTISYGDRDDGELEQGAPWPEPRFTDNLDGTVTDNLTGLIWLKDANCFGQRTWNEALSDSNGLEDGQCNLTDGSNPGDWRLPHIKELRSLVDFSNYAPVLPTGHPFNVVLSYYWSSTSYSNNSSIAWQVHIRYSTEAIIDKTHSAGNYVWPVRGGQ